MSVQRSRTCLVSVLGALALLASVPARGQTGGTAGTNTVSDLAPTDFTVYYEQNQGDGQWVRMNDTEVQYFFNRVRCECGQSTKAKIRVVIVPSAGASTKVMGLLQKYQNPDGGRLRLYGGGNTYDCLNPSSSANIRYYCTNLLNPSNYDEFQPMSVFSSSSRWTSPEIPVVWLFNAVPGSGASCGYNSPHTCDDISVCSGSARPLNIYIWMQTAVGTTPDSGVAKFLMTPSASLVGQVPAMNTPINLSATGGMNALTVKWDWPSGFTPTSSFKGIQIFCRRGGFAQVFDNFKPAFTTYADVCPDSPPTSSPAQSEFSNLDPKFLCSDLRAPTEKSYRIEKLQNDIVYDVGIVAIDKYGNASTISSSSIVSASPVATVDFYTYYKEHGAANGGYCTIATAHGRRSAALLMGLVGLGLLFVLRRKSRRGPPGAGSMLILVALGSALLAGQAHAQNTFRDSSFVEERSEREPWRGTKQQFAIEARFGLYTPNVDSEFSGPNAPQPNAFIFGSKRRPMWQLEFDWEVLRIFGTLSLGGAIGYYKENAEACLQAELKADPKTCTASGDNTSLRLIPLAALVIYRFDEPARRWGIPLVPYAKVGLNYTIWTVTDGNGDVPSAGGGRGQGGTAGWQTALGLSLQLDFFDPGAARGFDADVGVNHTYAFFEMAHIDGSGLYRKDVLRVGDNTWFAGLMFEF